MASSDSNSNLKITVESNPPESRLAELNVKGWPKWACAPGTIAYKYDAEQTCYLLKGKVKVYHPKGSKLAEFGAGDLVIIPEGLSCTWVVSIPVDMYYQFKSSDAPSSSSST